MNFIPRFFQKPEQSFFLFGPRGTGKSTLMEAKYPNALSVNLLQPEVLRSFLARPERLQELVRGSSKDNIVIIDEIQKAPGLLSVVHSLIEEKTGLQFILTGSSARKLKRTGADLLGGRALKRTLYPFMASELQEEFSLTKALQFGMLPLVWDKKNPHDTLQAYISLYLHEEIQAEGLVRNLENFARFLEIVSFSHASLLNIANIARECEIKRKTVENYIHILEELLLAFHLPPFTKRVQRALVSHPKFYLFDSGVYGALRPKGPFDKPEEIAGASLEGLVAQHLRAWNDYSQQDNQLSFWRTREGLEVDFVVYGPQGIWAIEVKHSQRVSSQDTRSLKVFLEDYPMAHALLLYCGTEQLRMGNVLVLPCEKFLKQLKPGMPLNS